MIEEIVVESTNESVKSELESDIENSVEKPVPIIVTKINKVPVSTSVLSKNVVNNSHKCKTCGKSFKRLSSFRIHFLQKHRVITNKLKCTICEKVRLFTKAFLYF